MVLGSCTSEQAASFSSANVAATQTIQNAAAVLELSRLTPVEVIARNSAVKVSDPFGRGHGSGTYVKMHGRYVVVTAAHVVGQLKTMFIEARDGEVVVGRVVFCDFDADLAILVVPQIQSRIAAPWRPCKDDTNLLGAHLTYTGFPGHHDLLTIRGHVAALEREMVVANMFGWFGASGSGAFTQSGRFVGVVTGIDVGNWQLPIPLDSIVWVSPIWHLDKEMAKARIITAYPASALGTLPGAATPRRGGLRD
jgi:hypothetical protein